TREGFVFIDGNDFVDHAAIEHLRDEAGADALNRVRADAAARERRCARRLDRDDQAARPPLLEHLSDTRDGSAGAHAGHERVDVATRIIPDFFGSGAAMYFGIGRVAELIERNRSGPRA